MPSDKTGLLVRAYRHLLAGESACATALLQEWLAIMPMDVEALHLLAHCAHHQTDRQGAERLLCQAMVAGAVREANIRRALGDRAGMVETLISALSFDRYNFDVLTLLGEQYHISTEWSEADQERGWGPTALYHTPLGRYVLPTDAPRDVIALCMKAGQVFEAEIIDILRPLVVPGQVVLDVGANFGQMTLIFSELVGPHGRVHAFEANNYVHDILCRNIRANRRTNITPIYAAVYKRSGLELVFPPPDFSRFSAYGSFGVDPTATTGTPVQTLALDDMQIEGPICLMKVDVQGADLSVLKGARDMIARHRMPIIFELEEQFLERFNETRADYFRFVEEIGYDVVQVVNGINFLITPK